MQNDDTNDAAANQSTSSKSTGKSTSAKPTGAKKSTKSVSRTKKAGLQFSVSRVEKNLRQGHYADRIGATAPVNMAAVMEYLTAEVLELAGNAARDNGKSRITPRHLNLAIRNDEEIARLLRNVTISEGGVLPNIQAVLVPGRTSGSNGKGKKKSKSPKVKVEVKGQAAPEVDSDSDSSDEDDSDFEPEEPRGEDQSGSDDSGPEGGDGFGDQDHGGPSAAGVACH